MNSKKLKNYLIFFLLFYRWNLRIYNINFDDLWSDEMISVGYQTHQEAETIKLIRSNLMVTYELGLKYFHSLFVTILKFQDISQEFWGYFL